ncbi:hypothetical protein JCM11641_004567 [Rhodosporidiobolus odoratus]
MRPSTHFILEEALKLCARMLMGDVLLEQQRQPPHNLLDQYLFFDLDLATYPFYLCHANCCFRCGRNFGFASGGANPADEENPVHSEYQVPMHSEYLLRWYGTALRTSLGLLNGKASLTGLFMMDLKKGQPDVDNQDIPDDMYRLQEEIAKNGHTMGGLIGTCSFSSLQVYDSESFGNVFLQLLPQLGDWMMDLFSINAYLEDLLTDKAVLDWAARPNASALLRRSASESHHLRPILKRVNAVLTIDMASFSLHHSKQLADASRDGTALIVLTGSPNPFQQGYGAQGLLANLLRCFRSASYETAVLTILPAASVLAAQILYLRDCCKAVILQDKRLIAATSETTKSEHQLAGINIDLRCATPTTKALLIPADLAASADELVKLLDTPPTRSELLVGRRPLNLDVGNGAIAKAGERVRALWLAIYAEGGGLVLQMTGPGKNPGNWHKNAPGERVAVEILCCTCGRFLSCTLPSTEPSTYKVNHRPSNNKNTYSGTFTKYNSVANSVYDPHTDVRQLHALVTWYTTVDVQLAKDDIMCLSLRNYLHAGLPSSHPQHGNLQRLVDKQSAQGRRDRAELFFYLAPAYTSYRSLGNKNTPMGVLESYKLTEIIEARFPFRDKTDEPWKDRAGAAGPGQRDAKDSSED